MSNARGRPPVSPGEPSLPVSTRLPESVVAEVRRVAFEERREVAEVLRTAITDFCIQKSTNRGNSPTVER